MFPVYATNSTAEIKFRVESLDRLVLWLAALGGLLVYSIGKYYKDSKMYVNYGIPLLLCAAILGAALQEMRFHSPSESFTISTDKIFSILEPDQLSTVLGLTVPILVFAPSYAMPTHLFSKEYAFNFGAYALVAFCIPSLLMGLLFKWISCRTSHSDCYHGSMFESLKSATFILSALVTGVLFVVGDTTSTYYDDQSHNTQYGQILFLLEGDYLTSAICTTVVIQLLKLQLYEMPLPYLLFFIVEIPISIAVGEFCIWTMYSLHKNKVRDSLLVVLLALVIYEITTLSYTSGVLCAILYGLYLSRHRVSIYPQSAATLTNLVEVLFRVSGFILFFLSGLLCGKLFIEELRSGNFKDLAWYPLLGFCSFLFRLVFSLAISRCLGSVGCFEWNWKQELIRASSNFGGPFSLGMALIHHTYVRIFRAEIDRGFIYVAINVWLSLIFKFLLFPYLMFKLSAEGAIYKKYHLMELKSNIYNLAEMDKIILARSKLVADARWDLVEENFVNTLETPAIELKGVNKIVEDKTLLQQLSNAIRIAVLRLQISSFARQFQEGELTEWASKLLTSLAESTIARSLDVVTVDILNKHTHLSKIWTEVGHICTKWKTKLQLVFIQHPPAPKNPIRLLCYKIDMSMTYEVLVHIIVLTHMIFSFVELSQFIPMFDEFKNQQINTNDANSSEHEAHEKVHLPHWYANTNEAFYIFYILEFIIKFTALSNHTFYTKWNYLDLIFAVISIIDLMMEFFLYKVIHEALTALLILQLLFLLLRLLKLFRFVKVLIPGMVLFSQHKLNQQLNKGFELLRGLIISEEDAVRVMKFAVESEINRLGLSADNIKRIAPEFEMTKQKCRNLHRENRKILLKKMCIRSSKYANLMVSVKTKKAILLIGEKLRQKLLSWKNSGEIEAIEFDNLLSYVMEKEIRGIDSIPPSLSLADCHDVIRLLPWVLVGGTNLNKYLNETLVPKQVKAGTILCTQGETKNYNLIIVISGFLTLTIKDKNVVILEEYFGTGSTLGEQSLLTLAPRSGSLEALTDANLCIINQHDAQTLFSKFPSVKKGFMREYCINKIYSDIFIHEEKFKSLTETRMKHIIAEGEFIDLWDEKHTKGGYRRNEQYAYLFLVYGSCIAHSSDELSPTKYAKFTVKRNVIVLSPHYTHIRQFVNKETRKASDCWLFALPQAQRFNYEKSLSAPNEILTLDKERVLSQTILAVQKTESWTQRTQSNSSKETKTPSTALTSAEVENVGSPISSAETNIRTAALPNKRLYETTL